MPLFFFAKICHNVRVRGESMNEGQRMEAEQRYISGNETLAELAANTKIPLANLKRWCKQYEWVKKREKFQKRALRKATTKAADKKARELARLLEASDAMENALVMAAKAMAAEMANSPGEIPDGKFRAANIDSLAKAIGRQVESRMLISGVMAAADREKIDLLKRKQEMDERKERQEANGGGLTIRLEEAGEEPIIE